MEKKLSTHERRMAERFWSVLLVRGENQDGEAIYAYVRVRGDRLQEFMAAQGSGNFFPEDFGEIIESGEGDPPEEVRRKMEIDWGFRHEGMTDIADEGKAYEIMTKLPDITSPGDQP